MPLPAFKIHAPRSAGRRGITLIELLIVMVIVSIVTAASIPLLTTGAESRRVREAARLVSSYISSAKSRAIETGRPAGVMIQRYASQNYALTLVGVEVPPPYAGDTATSLAMVSSEKLTAATGATYPTGTYGTITGFLSDSGWAGIVRPGDLIQFGYQGHWYLLYGPTSPLDVLNGVATLGNSPLTIAQAPVAPATAGAPGPWYLVATDGSGSLPPGTVNGTTTQLPYQISRQPVKSAAQPLQMPGDTVIDLCPPSPPVAPSFPGASGVGIAGAFTGAGPYTNPILMFGPTGAVGYAYYDNNPPQHLPSTLYLMVGTRDGMEDLGAGVTNLNHHRSMWVAVGPASGLVVTTENMVTGSNTLPYARQYAQQASSIGGR
jgi:prepilin-type N-terminal cleavage/methylation domain-containing protein